MSPPFDGLDGVNEHAVVSRRKPLTVPAGQAEVFRLFQQIASDWKPQREALEGSGELGRGVAGTPRGTTETDADAVRDLLLEMLDALSGLKGWEGVRRAHDALKEKDRDLGQRYARVVGVVTWAIWAWRHQTERDQRLRVVDMLRRGLTTEERRFSKSRLSDADVMAILDGRKPHERPHRIAARLAFKAGVFSTVDAAFEAYRPKQSKK